MEGADYVTLGWPKKQRVQNEQGNRGVRTFGSYSSMSVWG